MARFCVLAIFLTVLMISFPAHADSNLGRKIFKGNKCDTCHYPDTVSLGPTLGKIAETYKGRRDRLVRFLNGQEKPIVFPEKFESVMEAFLGNTKLLTLEQRKDLADYIMSHGKDSPR